MLWNHRPSRDHTLAQVNFEGAEVWGLGGGIPSPKGEGSGEGGYAQSPENCGFYYHKVTHFHELSGATYSFSMQILNSWDAARLQTILYTYKLWSLLNMQTSTSNWTIKLVLKACKLLKHINTKQLSVYYACKLVSGPCIQNAYYTLHAHLNVLSFIRH